MLPVGLMRGSSHLPVDLAKLSHNLASMLNNNGPLHHIEATHEMYFERHAEGLNFRFRDHDAGGTSEVGAMFTLLPGVTMDFADVR